ncbi:peroxiredoxin [Candidatus Pelagibacter sp.]|nr:peroxiredoxin [Candidatus Pelagibacter sp.]
MKLSKISKAPNFTLEGTNNKTITLKSIKSKYIVLYFYPKDDTPGCTIETNDFNKLLLKFKKLNCEVYGISKDSIKSHKKFKTKYKIKFDLLSDEEKKMIKLYKVWRKKKFMGKEFMGVVRTTFLLNQNRDIIKTWKNVKVKDHAQEVLSFLKFI